MADVFEKVELSFCRRFSPCLCSRPSAKPELPVRLAADVKRWEIVHEYELHTEKELDTTHMTRTKVRKSLTGVERDSWEIQMLSSHSCRFPTLDSVQKEKIVG